MNPDGSISQYPIEQGGPNPSTMTTQLQVSTGKVGLDCIYFET